MSTVFEPTGDQWKEYSVTTLGQRNKPPLYYIGKGLALQLQSEGDFNLYPHADKTCLNSSSDLFMLRPAHFIFLFCLQIHYLRALTVHLVAFTSTSTYIYPFYFYTYLCSEGGSAFRFVLLKLLYIYKFIIVMAGVSTQTANDCTRAINVLTPEQGGLFTK